MGKHAPLAVTWRQKDVTDVRNHLECTLKTAAVHNVLWGLESAMCHWIAAKSNGMAEFKFPEVLCWILKNLTTSALTNCGKNTTSGNNTAILASEQTHNRTMSSKCRFFFCIISLAMAMLVFGPLPLQYHWTPNMNSQNKKAVLIIHPWKLPAHKPSANKEAPQEAIEALFHSFRLPDPSPAALHARRTENKAPELLHLIRTRILAKFWIIMPRERGSTPSFGNVFVSPPCSINQSFV